MKRLVTIVLLLLTTSVIAEERVLLRMQGSNTIGAELAPQLVQSWLKARDYTHIELVRTSAEESLVRAVSPVGDTVVVPIRAHGSSTAFQGLAAGVADIGMASRSIKEKEVEQLAALGPMQSVECEFVLGLDGIAVIVNPQNPLTSLDKTTLGRIFTGEVVNWREVGGLDRPIHVYARDDKSGTYDTFKHLVLGKVALTAGAKRFESNAKLSDEVAADPNGIGFVGLPYVHQSKALAVADGAVAIRPDTFTVATEDYALARRLFLYLPQQANTFARDLVKFAIGATGQQQVAATGFVSQELVTGGAVATATSSPEYQALVAGAERLSVNFRFHPGSAFLDNKARQDIHRLAEYVSQQENHRRELILVGFSDNNEAIPMQSLALSVQRADGVADVLLTEGVATHRVRGFGPAVTVATNDTLQGREKNRRVEVWLR